MHKRNWDTPQMLRQFKTIAAWCWDSYSSSQGRNLVGPLSLFWVWCCFYNDSLHSNAEHYFHYWPSFIEVKILFILHLVSKKGTGTSLVKLKWHNMNFWKVRDIHISNSICIFSFLLISPFSSNKQQTYFNDLC